MILVFLLFAFCPGLFLNSLFKCMEKIHRGEEYADDRFWAILSLSTLFVALAFLPMVYQ